MKFDFLLRNMIGEMILRHSDNLSRTLQKKTTSASEGQLVVIETLQSLRKQECYDLFWLKISKEEESYGNKETTNQFHRFSTVCLSN